MDATERAMLQAVYDRMTEPNINGGTLPAAIRALHNTLVLGKYDSLAIGGEAYTLVDFVRYIDRHVYQLNREKVPALQAALAAAGTDVDEAALAAAVAPLLRPMLEEMVAAARSSDVTVDALVDEFLERATAGSQQQAAAG